jgi:hypothetical protein
MVMLDAVVVSAVAVGAYALGRHHARAETQHTHRNIDTSGDVHIGGSTHSRGEATVERASADGDLQIHGSIHGTGNVEVQTDE